MFEPLFEILGASYHVHLKLIGKCIVDFLLVIKMYFFTSCCGWGYLLKICVFEGTGSVWPKFPVHGVFQHQPFLSQNWKYFSFLVVSEFWQKFFYHFVIIHAFDRQTDGLLYDRQDSPCTVCSIVKMYWLNWRCGEDGAGKLHSQSKKTPVMTVLCLRLCSRGGNGFLQWAYQQQMQWAQEVGMVVVT